jgi:hypothetical protein
MCLDAFLYSVFGELLVFLELGQDHPSKSWSNYSNSVGHLLIRSVNWGPMSGSRSMKSQSPIGLSNVLSCIHRVCASINDIITLTYTTTTSVHDLPNTQVDDVVWCAVL